MQVFIPNEVAKHATNKYLGVLVAAKYARVLNEFPRDRSAPGDKKLTTRSLEELTDGEVEYRVVPRRRAEQLPRVPLRAAASSSVLPGASPATSPCGWRVCLHRRVLKST